MLGAAKVTVDCFKLLEQWSLRIDLEFRKGASKPSKSDVPLTHD